VRELLAILTFVLVSVTIYAGNAVIFDGLALHAAA
jgi:hypothetical protein